MSSQMFREFGFPQVDDKVFGPNDLEAIRNQIEELDRIEAVNPAVRASVLRYWPELAHKLPPEDADPPRLSKRP